VTGYCESSWTMNAFKKNNRYEKASRIARREAFDADKKCCYLRSPRISSTTPSPDSTSKSEALSTVSFLSLPGTSRDQRLLNLPLDLKQKVHPSRSALSKRVRSLEAPSKPRIPEKPFPLFTERVEAVDEIFLQVFWQDVYVRKINQQECASHQPARVNGEPVWL
jgi:hypothetical protein